MKVNINGPIREILFCLVIIESTELGTGLKELKEGVKCRSPARLLMQMENFSEDLHFGNRRRGERPGEGAKRGKGIFFVRTTLPRELQKVAVAGLLSILQTGNDYRTRLKSL